MIYNNSKFIFSTYLKGYDFIYYKTLCDQYQLLNNRNNIKEKRNIDPTVEII